MYCRRRIGEIEWIFWSKVDWDIQNIERCWLWIKGTHPKGYAQFRFTDIYGKRCIGYAHRIAYEFEFGEIPRFNEFGEVLLIDHICHDPKICQLGNLCVHRKCCNPFHMKLVTIVQNSSSERVAGYTERGQRRSDAAIRGWKTRRARMNVEVQ